jgi:hypothetical protein
VASFKEFTKAIITKAYFVEHEESNILKKVQSNTEKSESKESLGKNLRMFM